MLLCEFNSPFPCSAEFHAWRIQLPPLTFGYNKPQLAAGSSLELRTVLYLDIEIGACSLLKLVQKSFRISGFPRLRRHDAQCDFAWDDLHNLRLTHIYCVLEYVI